MSFGEDLGRNALRGLTEIVAFSAERHRATKSDETLRKDAIAALDASLASPKTQATVMLP